MSLVLWLVVLPVGTVPVVYLLRRRRLGAVVAAFVALILGWMVLQLPIGMVWSLLGRTIEVDQLSQVTLSLLFVTTAILFLVASCLPSALPVEGGGINHGRTKGRESRVFYPVGLATLSFFVAASLSRHLGITAIFVECAAMLTVFVIQGERLESARAALRFLVLMSLAMPLFLLAAWRVDLYQLSGGLEATTNLRQLMLFVGLGFALWLAVVPFHSWTTTTAAESSPPTAAFVLIVFPIVAFSTLLHLHADFPWMFESPQMVTAIIAAGILTACLGGFLASVQRGFSELMGYAALYDLGATLTIFGIGGQDERVAILVGLMVRSLSLVLVAASILAIRLRTSGDGFAQLKGIAAQMPLATTGLIVGGLTLVGVPFTAGFAPRWQLFQTMAETDSRGATLLALAGLGVAIGYLRGLKAMLTPAGLGKQRGRSNDRISLFLQGPAVLTITIILLVLVSILLGLYPSILIDPIRNLLGDILFLPLQ